MRLLYMQLALNAVLTWRPLGVRPMSIVVLDHKGSRALYHHTVHLTKLFGAQLRTFSIEPKMPSNLFNWFGQAGFDEVDPMELAQQLCSCLNVAVGDEHGASYFGASGIARAFESLRGKKRAGDFRAFHEALVNPSTLSHVPTALDPKTARDSNHLLSQVLIAAQVHAMNVRQGENDIGEAEMTELKAHAIDLPSLFRG